MNADARRLNQKPQKPKGREHSSASQKGKLAEG